MARQELTSSATGEETHLEAVEPFRILVPSPIGQLGIEFRRATVCRIWIQPPRRDRKLFRPLKEVKRSEFLDEALGQLSEYFAGARTQLELNWDLGPSGVTGFSRRVLHETARVPYGQTQTHQKIAALAGDPSAYRLVRSILAANPIPILIPCHRIVPKRGGTGSYVAGEKKKHWLLRLESRGVEQI
jgi:methylated-DNA-[protein]-cysteine S-methyltransferase